MTWKVYSWRALVGATILATVSVRLPAQTGEKIQEQKPGACRVYLAGAVSKPGSYILGEGQKISTLQALSMAEGLAAMARPGSALIIRRTANGSRITIPANLNKILKGKKKDLELVEGDILYVPSMGGKGHTDSTADPPPLSPLPRRPTFADGRLRPQNSSGHGMCTLRLRR